MWTVAGLIFLLLFVASIIVVVVGLVRHDRCLVKRWLIVGGTALVIYIIIMVATHTWGGSCTCSLHNCCSAGCNCSCVKGGFKLLP